MNKSATTIGIKRCLFSLSHFYTLLKTQSICDSNKISCHTEKTKRTTESTVNSEQ